MSPAESELRALWRDPTVTHIEAHTSGSTGAPKRIMLAKSDMELSARSTCRFFGIDGSAHLHCPLSLDYIAGKMMVVRSEVSGATLTVAQPSADPLAGADGRRIDLLPIVPMQIEGLLASEHLRHVGNVIVGGAPMNHRQELMLTEGRVPAFATYGMTETSSHVALRRVGEQYFRALPGYTFATDGRGCLVISHDATTWGRLATNDVVELVDAATFRWLGRLDSAIITGGVKVLPEEVERAARQAGLDMPLYATGRPHPRLGMELVLVVDTELELDEDEIIGRLRGMLPRYHAPRAVVRGKVPTGANGKILRRPQP